MVALALIITIIQWLARPLREIENIDCPSVVSIGDTITMTICGKPKNGSFSILSDIDHLDYARMRLSDGKAEIPISVAQTDFYNVEGIGWKGCRVHIKSSSIDTSMSIPIKIVCPIESIPGDNMDRFIRELMDELQKEDEQ